MRRDGPTKAAPLSPRPGQAAPEERYLFLLDTKEKLLVIREELGGRELGGDGAQVRSSPTVGSTAAAATVHGS